MGSVFEDRAGYIVRTNGGSATRALLRVTGLLDGSQATALGRPGSTGETYGQNVIFVTGLNIQRGVNNNIAYTLDNHIFLSVAGDRMGSMSLQGMVFGSSCDSSAGGAYGNGARHQGFTELMRFYDSHKARGGQSVPPRIDVFYGSAVDGGTKRNTGYVAGLQTVTSDKVSASMDFTLTCLLVP